MTLDLLDDLPLSLKFAGPELEVGVTAFCVGLVFGGGVDTKVLAMALASKILTTGTMLITLSC